MSTVDGEAWERVPGWPPVTAGSLGAPQVVRWVSIDHDGTISTCESVNVAGYLPSFGVRIQWRLMRDVSTLICAPGHLGLRHIAAVHSTAGTVLSPRPSPEDPEVWPVNEVATAMVHALCDRAMTVPLYGTVAWLGELDPRGLHVDLSPDRVAALAEQAWRRG